MSRERQNMGAFITSESVYRIHARSPARPNYDPRGIGIDTSTWSEPWDRQPWAS